MYSKGRKIPLYTTVGDTYQSVQSETSTIFDSEPVVLGQEDDTLRRRRATTVYRITYASNGWQKPRDAVEMQPSSFAEHPAKSVEEVWWWCRNNACTCSLP